MKTKSNSLKIDNKICKKIISTALCGFLFSLFLFLLKLYEGTKAFYTDVSKLLNKYLIAYILKCFDLFYQEHAILFWITMFIPGVLLVYHFIPFYLRRIRKDICTLQYEEIIVIFSYSWMISSLFFGIGKEIFNNGYIKLITIIIIPLFWGILRILGLICKYDKR